MAKMKKSQLKAVVKECLFEIISEDIVEKSVKKAVNEAVRELVPLLREQIQRDVTPGPQPRQAKQEQPSGPEVWAAINERVNNVNSNTEQTVDSQQDNSNISEAQDWAERFQKFKQATMGVPEQPTININVQPQPSAADKLNINNDVMRHIFEDTEKTTVREQAGAEHATNSAGAVDLGHPDDAGIDITQLFNPNWGKMV